MKALVQICGLFFGMIVATTLTFSVLSMGDEQVAPEAASIISNRQIIFTEATIEMSIDEIIAVEGIPSTYEELELYYNNRDYLGREGEGWISYAPFIPAATWGVTGAEAKVNAMFDEIRVLISERLEEELYSEMSYSGVCKWIDTNTGLVIILSIFDDDDGKTLELFYYSKLLAF